MAIRYYEQEVKSKLTNRRLLSSFLQSLIKLHRPGIEKTELIFIFCDDDYLLEINKEYLNHDTFTDIITFDLSESQEKLEGEIYISVNRIKENATNFHTSYIEELHRVIFHGVLHLCGFKDKSKSDKTRMRQEEDICIEQYFNN